LGIGSSRSNISPLPKSTHCTFSPTKRSRSSRCLPVSNCRIVCSLTPSTLQIACGPTFAAFLPCRKRAPYSGFKGCFNFVAATVSTSGIAAYLYRAANVAPSISLSIAPMLKNGQQAMMWVAPDTRDAFKQIANSTGETQAQAAARLAQQEQKRLERKAQRGGGRG
jgi:hypothetical protein